MDWLRAFASIPKIKLKLGDSMASRTRLFASFLLAAFLAAVCVCGACSKAPADRGAGGQLGGAAKPTIVFMTDFGTANDAVAVCKAVIVSIAPDARLMDITHQVTPFQIEEAARFLWGVTPYYPSGTVFLVVVDPGVGTSRKAVIVKTKKGQYFVLPDNGIITPVIERDGLDSAREITNTAWMLVPKVSSTFHGRDIFSPAAAHLAEGWDFTLAGPAVSQLVQLTPKASSTSEKGIDGDIIGLDDPFGSLITDIPGEEFKKLGYSLGDNIIVQLNKKPFRAPYVRTFMNVPVGEPLLYIDSRGRIGLALNQRNFSQVNKIVPPGTLFIPRKGAAIKK
jgi:S-adenosylmethionine hydrolase